MSAPVVGETLPAFTVHASTVQLFLFSAVTWNPHRIHYDEPYTTGVEGHDGVVVQGPLIGAWVLELAQAWVSGWGEVVETDYRNVAPAFAGDELTVSGEVVEAGAEPVAKVTVTRVDGTPVCTGRVVARCA